MTKGNFFRTKDRARMISQSEQKRRTCSEFQNPIYDNRIHTYRELIFKVNIAHGIYAETEKDLNIEYAFKNEMRYKAWVGSGNNGNLIKGLIKRRFWWTLLEEKSLNANFIWTQLRVNEFFTHQPPSSMWMKDTSKFWGKTPQIEEPSKLIKKLARKKKE